MATNYPTNLDTLTNPTATDKVSVVSHADQHANANDAIEALEAKVGADSSAVTTSHDYKLGGVTGSDKAASLTGTETLTNKTLTSPLGITATDVGLGNVTNNLQVNQAGAQTVDGVKTFSSSPIVPTPTTDFQTATKEYVDSNTGVGAPDVVALITGNATASYPNFSTDDITVKFGMPSAATTFWIKTDTGARAFTNADFANIDTFESFGVYNGDFYVLGRASSSPFQKYLSKIDLTDLAGATEEVIDITTNSVLVDSSNKTQMVIVQGVFYFSYNTSSTVLKKSTLTGTTLGAVTSITLTGGTYNFANGYPYAILTDGSIALMGAAYSYELFNSSGVSQGLRENSLTTEALTTSGFCTYYDASLLGNVIYVIQSQSENRIAIKTTIF